MSFFYVSFSLWFNLSRGFEHYSFFLAFYYFCFIIMLRFVLWIWSFAWGAHMLFEGGFWVSLFGNDEFFIIIVAWLIAWPPSNKLLPLHWVFVRFSNWLSLFLSPLFGSCMSFLGFVWVCLFVSFSGVLGLVFLSFSFGYCMLYLGLSWVSWFFVLSFLIFCFIAFSCLRFSDWFFLFFFFFWVLGCGFWMSFGFLDFLV